jgi:hypothetical protein
LLSSEFSLSEALGFRVGVDSGAGMEFCDPGAWLKFGMLSGKVLLFETPFRPLFAGEGTESFVCACAVTHKDKNRRIRNTIMAASLGC